MRRWAFVCLVAACSVPPPGAPSIASIEPSSGLTTKDTPVRVEGAGFHRALSTDLDNGTTQIGACSATVGTMPLASVAWRTEELIEGTVPAGMTPGPYDVTVTCGAASTTLPDAFTVLPDTPPTQPWGTPTLVAAISSPTSAEDDPSITADRLELYFNSDRAGSTGLDIWVVRRATATDPWSLPSNVTALNAAGAETTPKVSADGLTIYFASDRAGANDVWVSTRASRSDPWSAPVLVPELNSASSDTGANESATRRSLVMCSDRDGISLDAYLATRASPTDPWSTPVPVAEINTATYEADPMLAFQDRALLFSSDRPGDLGGGDIWISTRASTASPFDAPVGITELNSTSYEEDPFVTDDLRYILFTSNRSGDFEIYEASR